jgi:hypothetical protein
VSWCWFAHLPNPHAEDLSEVLASASVAEPGGRPAGLLAAWPRGRKPVPAALRMDKRVVDPGGPPAWVSLVLVSPEVAPLFDDPAVSQAMRRVLAGPPFAAASTLVRDAVHFAGAVTVEQGDRPERLADDPFARLHPARACCGSARACSAACHRHQARLSSAMLASPGRWPGSTPPEQPMRRTPRHGRPRSALTAAAPYLYTLS